MYFFHGELIHIFLFLCRVVQKPKHQVLILQNFLPQGCLTYSCLHSEFQMGSSLASLTSCTFSTNQQKAPSIKVTSKCSLPGPQSSWVRVPGHAKESETGTFGLDGKIKSIFFLTKSFHVSSALWKYGYWIHHNFIYIDSCWFKIVLVQWLLSRHLFPKFKLMHVRLTGYSKLPLDVDISTYDKALCAKWSMWV